ncbi:UDP-N-acetylglucosamine 2-epimerase [Pelagibacteraceae bacterium]|nr:UDP-N-acetylglucosamine 2-epimerase [Pelagibacteraceae bacterium]
MKLLEKKQKEIIKLMSLSRSTICVITSSRADYGLLKNLIFEIKRSKKFNLKLITTGTHLSFKHGLTYKEIIKDNIKINGKIKILKNSDTAISISYAMSDGIKKFSRTYSKIRPDLILILGDKFEIFSAAIAAMLSRIPIGHIHGGESTEGAIDEAIRHSITKMSHLHFVAAKKYRDRVVQLGESPKNVYCVGGMGVDTIKKTKFYKKKVLEKKIGFKLGKKNILVNFHPVTIRKKMTKIYIKEILYALKNFKYTRVIFTMPNADHESDVIFREISGFVKNNKNSIVFKSLGSLAYLSCLKLMDVIVGNSSSGLLEAPSLKVPTINIGDRQQGRLRAKSINNCLPKKKEIIICLRKILGKKSKYSVNYFKSVYGKGGASKKILSILEKTNFNNLLKKSFYDL